MSRLIDADFACKGCIRYRSSLSCEECVVNDAPTVDAVPVVRCRECKYSSYDEIFGNRWCNSHLGCRKVKDDGYCYLGERKEGAE